MFCSKCGKPLSDGAAFCTECGAPQGADGAVSVRKPISAKTVGVIVEIVSFLLIATVVVFVLTSVNKLSGKYANGKIPYTEKYYYTVEFKSNGTCIWTQDGRLFPGTYEYTDGEYIINITGNGYYLSTTFRAKKVGDKLYLTGGIFRNSEFFKVQ